MAKRRDVKVTQDPDAPIPIEIMAETIVKVSEGMKAVLDAGLTRRALGLLIKDRLNGVSLSTIDAVLDAVPDLKLYYLTQDGRAKVSARSR